MPNAFTPNNDGKNDVFKAVTYNLQEFSMRVYDRWGLLMYSTDNPNDGWDGTYKNNPAQMDVYVYKIEYSFLKETGQSDSESVVGTVTLIR